MNKEFMKLAITEAQKAAEKGEVPVGAVIVKNGEVIASAHNETEKKNNPLCHAEFMAVQKALENLGTKNLSDCTLYVTLEPCPMCMGALLHSRIGSIVFGAFDEKTGSVTTRADLTEMEYFRKPKITGGYMEDESRNLLKDFFQKRR
jgi:tRNA(adenine34) deaminase